MKLFLYVLSFLTVFSLTFAIRCYTGQTFGYNMPVNSSQLQDCNYLLQGSQSCMKIFESYTGTNVRFCQQQACNGIMNGMLTSQPCMNTSWTNIQGSGFYLNAQGGSGNWQPRDFNSQITICCCNGDGCNGSNSHFSTSKVLVLTIMGFSLTYFFKRN